MSKGLQAPPLSYQGARQKDLAVAGPNCPTCGQPWHRIAMKVCRLCGEIIGRGHKFRWVPAGPGLFALEHHNCVEPRAVRDG